MSCTRRFKYRDGPSTRSFDLLPLPVQGVIDIVIRRHTWLTAVVVIDYQRCYIARCGDGQSTHSIGLCFQSRRRSRRYLQARMQQKAVRWCSNVVHKVHLVLQLSGYSMVNRLLTDSSYQLEVTSHVRLCTRVFSDFLFPIFNYQK